MMERSWVGSRFQIEAHIACDSPGRVWGIWSKDFQGKIFHSLGWVWTLQMWHCTAIDFRSRDKPSGETEGKGRAFCHFWASGNGPSGVAPRMHLLPFYYRAHGGLCLENFSLFVVLYWGLTVLRCMAITQLNFHVSSTVQFAFRKVINRSQES